MKRLFILVLICMVISVAFAQVPDPTKIPHYFGPYPNWANSPMSTVDALVDFVDTCGSGGTGATAIASVNSSGTITGITVTNQGTGYTCPPDVVVTSTNGTGASATASVTPSAGFISSITLNNPGLDYFLPIVAISGDGNGATADATVDPYSGAITGITLTSQGSGYTNATIVISDLGGTGSGASASATLSASAISVTVVSGGTGYRTAGGLRKFVDTLPGLGAGGANNLGQYISVAHPDTTTYPGADYYEIGLVEYTKKLHSDLPPTKLRGYVQLNNGSDPACVANNSTCNTITPEPPQFLGSTIVASKNRPVRILFKNMLPTGAGGNLFLPVDTTLMGAGMGPDMGGMKETDNGTVLDGVRNPMCGVSGPKPMGCYAENRATLHLHGGTTPWISDGTPHQWTTPAGESTSYKKGVSVSYVPDMWYDATGNTIAACAGQTACNVAGATNDPGEGALTFYYTNQQSARLLFYHDHAWGITRLNVYAGEAAGYLITDDTEQKLVAPGGPLADVGLGIPLVIQDRTFVPSTQQLAAQDPTWDATRWGTMGNFWYHHVYMPAQNPADPTGVSPYGRWMYGPWFWPPANSDTTPYQPIANPYFDATCDPATAPNGFCEPPQIPGTPNISVGMEQFNDTPMVNGTPYPTFTVQPKAYRFRILNAANDRFFNLQWYVADASGTEVALKPSEVAAAQNDPNVVPTPDTNVSPAGPKWIQIGTEGGFLPTPVIVNNQPITWITDPTRFDFGNVDQHAMLVAPAERTDVIVDFSQFAGKTLILYNDAPAAFPARQASYDYYTGDPDNSDIGGAATTIPGYGPNTRTIMQIKVDANGTPAPFNLAPLVTAFQHKADGTGVFESGQHPIIVGQAGYNRAYGTSFTASGYCSSPTSTNKCDGFARIQQQGGDPFTFDTLSGLKLSIPLQPKALHDEMNSTTFDEYGRMQANLGVEAVPATAATQNIILYPYVNPATEVIDATALPSGMQVTPIASAADGTQIWKITHNGVDTHPIHFHLYDVQVINRVTWDNIIIAPDATELGWKDTVRVSPLEDTLVALRPIVPVLPFPIPDSVRPLNPMMPLGSPVGFNNVDPSGNGTNPILNDLVNFGWEYVWHCHILSHEEMDMMRPVMVQVPPRDPSALGFLVDSNGVTFSWQDNAANETNYEVQRDVDPAFPNAVDLTLESVITSTPNTAFGSRLSIIDPNVPAPGALVYYRVRAVDDYSPNSAVTPIFTPKPTASKWVSAKFVPQPTATVTPLTVTFGNQLVNTTSGPQSVTLTNTGGAPLVLDPTVNAAYGITLAGANPGDFATSNCPTNLAAAASCNISLTFTPTLVGPRAATLNIGSNDPVNPVISVTLTGTGIANTTTAINAPAVTYNQDGTVTVTVSAVGGTPTGNVSLTVDGGTPVLQPLDPAGSSVFTITSPAVGNHALIADYAAQGFFNASSAIGTLVVNRATLTITADAATKVYRAPLPAFTVTPTGLIGTDTLASLGFVQSCTTTATVSSPVGTYPIDCSASTINAASYVVTYVPGTLTITGTPLTITANPATKVYGAANPAFSVTAAGLLPPDTLVSLGFLRNCTTTATATSPVGTYPINCSASTINAANYAVTYVAGTLTVTQANSSITITAHRPSPSNIGAVVTASFRVTPQIAGGAATGNVTVTASTGETCTGTLLLNLGSCPVTFTTPGLRTLTASYAGDNNLRSSVSVAVSHIVTSPAASVAPNSLVFAAQRVNTNSPTQAVTLANLGNGSLNISSVTITGANATSFTRVAGGCGATLAVGRTCLITVRFRPTTLGAMNATLTINSNDPVNPALAVALSGTGVLPAATLSTTSLTFAAQTRNTTSAPQSVTLTNVGNAPLVITSAAVVTGNANNYIVTNVDCPIGGAGLAANGSCTVNVAFRPNAVGTRSSTLRFVDNAVPTTQTVTLSGTGQ